MIYVRMRSVICGFFCAEARAILLLRLLVAALLATAAGCQKSVSVRPEILELHNRFLVVDLHVDSPMVARVMGYDLGDRHRSPRWFVPWKLHADLPRLLEGGVSVVVFGIVVNPLVADPVASVERQIAFIRDSIVAANPNLIAIATDTDDIRRIVNSGRIAAWMSLEGAHELGGRLENLEIWRAQGVRSITLAHFSDNEFAYSSASGSGGGGLTPAGRQLVCEANRLGIVLDLAHTHQESFYEALASTRAPVIVSHTGVAPIQPTFRNLTTRQIAAVADNGGVIGIMLAGYWLDQGRWASVNTLVDHIDVVRDVGGNGTLAIGSDFDGLIWTPRGIRGAEDLPVISQALLDRGYTPDQLTGFWGENAMRVFRDVENVSRQMQESGEDCDRIDSGRSGMP